MTQYQKDEPYVIGIDFDGTVTTAPLGGYDFPKPQEGFVRFYNFIHEYNIEHSEDPIYFVVHTARNLDDKVNWDYIKDYLFRYQLNEVFLPKRDGQSMKNNLNRKLDFPIKFSWNSKIPCSCFVDDINVGTPKLENGDLDWDKIRELIMADVEKLKKYWADKD